MTLPEFPVEIRRWSDLERHAAALSRWYVELAQACGRRGLPRLEETFLRASRRERHPEMSPRQQPADLFVPGLGKTPFFEASEHECMRRLEAAYPAIRRELLALREQSRFTRYATSISGGDWLAFHFYEAGHRFEAECALCPETARAIDSIEGRDGGLVGFFALAPGGRIGAHYGMHNAKLRLSLGLSGCAGAGISVGGETREWHDGKCLALDDSYEHFVWHNGTETRFVLLMDVWHPSLSRGEIEVLHHYYTRSPVRALWLTDQKLESRPHVDVWWIAPQAGQGAGTSATSS